MKLFTGWVISAGLVVTAVTAHAQVVSPNGTGGSYTAVSDINGPYAAMPPEAPAPGYGYGPTLLPPREVYTVVRENGFSPLGIPRQHGLFYTIAVIDRGGDDGRLVIDARNGRIVRFMRAYRQGSNFNEDVPATYGPGRPLPPISNSESVPRPPALVPKVASRTPLVPMPKASPPRTDEVKPLAAKSASEKSASEKSASEKSASEKPSPEKPAPEPAQQSAAVQMKPADAPPAAAPSVGAAVEAKPAAPQILPTQEMPKVQGLE
jgi:hypothetical protein